MEITNKYIITETFPETADVRLLPQKKKNVQALKNLQPIDILPRLSKVLKKVFCVQLSLFLESNNILPNKFSGSKKFRSDITTLMDVLNNILTLQDSGKVTVLRLLDFSRAFDKINISLLRDSVW
ncbi:unnamed protein product [Euphydryas editha]|uniref:Reverse transcriptase domain-containing protein n=1 Tax=Euphydryas editha TaxID=104508 RepID=A0AAU9TK60_EUPED|nr:unnamed protein product [Euphydryas editha]